MTRQEILSTYKVNEYGAIVSDGIFKWQPIYVPYFWNMVLNDDYDDTFPSIDGDIQIIQVTDEERKEFPELPQNMTEIGLLEWKDGFISYYDFSGYMLANCGSG